MTKLIVSEHFLSLQGESTFAGELCFFIRLAGCNLRCSYCDTLMAQEFGVGNELSIAQIVELVRESGAKIVEVTGGEPLAQDGSIELLQTLIDLNFTVLLETNGAKSVANVPKGVHRIIDYKLPSSLMAEFMLEENFTRLTNLDEVKFVIANRDDYDFAKMIIKKYSLLNQGSKILFSPVWGSVEFEELATWVIEDKLEIKMQIQLHKIIWGAERSGV